MATTPPTPPALRYSPAFHSAHRTWKRPSSTAPPETAKTDLHWVLAMSDRPPNGSHPRWSSCRPPGLEPPTPTSPTVLDSGNSILPVGEGNLRVVLLILPLTFLQSSLHTNDTQPVASLPCHLPPRWAPGPNDLTRLPASTWLLPPTLLSTFPTPPSRTKLR